MRDPAAARVFIVGKNQKNGFSVSKVGSHDHYMDTLFNRGTETCRQLYDRVGKKSLTRNNIDTLARMLCERGVDDVLETNVICFSTNSSGDFANGRNGSGKEVGMRLFSTLLKLIQPQVIIAQGKSTAEYLGEHLGSPLPKPPEKPGDLDQVDVGGTTIFIIPTLDPRHFPEWNLWRDAAESGRSYLEGVCDRVVSVLDRGSPA